MSRIKSHPQTSVPLHQRLGILGGGQLARMMALRANELGLEVHILSESSRDPAAQVTHFWHQGNPHSKSDIVQFLGQIDFLTFESEFIDAKTIELAISEHNSKYNSEYISEKKILPKWPISNEITASAHPKEDTATFQGATAHSIPSSLRKFSSVGVFPSTQNLALAQDRLTQKKWLKKFGIESAKFIEVNSAADLEKAKKKFPQGFVLKLRTHGYDGYGTWIFRPPFDIANSKLIQGKRELPIFSKQACIAEALVDFKEELAITFVRDQYGNIAEFPLVKSTQKDSRCDSVQGPFHHPKINLLKEKIFKLLKKSDYVGAISFEMFSTKKELLINEIAPRVHNTAHYSQLALSEDQFLLHVKAVCGHSVCSPILLFKNFVMINLIGSGATDLKKESHSQEMDSPSIHNQENSLPRDFGKLESRKKNSAHLVSQMHWYGKDESKDGRKMGHLNFASSRMTQKSILDFANNERKRFRL